MNDVRGSPPLVRERLQKRRQFDVTARITPARAGKTPESDTTVLVGRDHPRSCGKDMTSSFEVIFAAGSPPLVRERLEGFIQGISYFRITPARAGKTILNRVKKKSNQDHPRSCGKDPKVKSDEAI